MIQMKSYEWVSDEMFYNELERQIDLLSASDIMSIPGAYEVLSEHLNDSVLDALEEERDLKEKEEEEEEEPKTWFNNFYFCKECWVHWVDMSECTNNDRCPKCRAEIEPYESKEEN